MTKYLAIFLLGLTLHCAAQPLRNVNYSYLYNPDHPVTMFIQPVRSAQSWTIYFQLTVKDTSQYRTSDYSLSWETLPDLGTKEGTPVSASQQLKGKTVSGTLTLPIANDPSIVSAKVSNVKLGQSWSYFTTLEPNYPKTTQLVSSGGPMFQKYAPTTSAASVQETSPLTVSYYNDVFPAAAPAFSEGQARVPKTLKADSVYSLSADDPLRFTKNGLYLIQRDTSSAEGLAIRAHDDYPRYSLIRNLPGPLMYICTKGEYDRLEAANGDKKAFDRTVLSITGDSERARRLIRNYFRRVELANFYFSSYKEGWRTDRGMIYIVFGLPDEVFRFNDREVWKYNNEQFKVTFNFVKSSSVFDPDNYVLIRDKKYQQTWYEVVDLWRNARF